MHSGPDPQRHMTIEQILVKYVNARNIRCLKQEKFCKVTNESLDQLKCMNELIKYYISCMYYMKAYLTDTLQTRITDNEVKNSRRARATKCDPECSTY